MLTVSESSDPVGIHLATNLTAIRNVRMMPPTASPAQATRALLAPMGDRECPMTIGNVCFCCVYRAVVIMISVPFTTDVQALEHIACCNQLVC